MQRKKNSTPKKAQYCSSFILVIGVVVVVWIVFIFSRFHGDSNAIKNAFNKATSVANQKLSRLHAFTPNQQTGKSDFDLTIKHGEEGEVHIVFSTDCTFYQDWQTLLVFHSAVSVGQRGHITRVASGCDAEKQSKLTTLYTKLFPQYYVHFTPDFKLDKKTGESYEFYNKPYGINHWLEYANPPIKEHVIIAIIDPDMVLIRPLTTRVAGEDNLISMKPILPIDEVEAKAERLPKYIKRGHPVSQLYGLGAPWAGPTTKIFNRTHVCGADSPCMNTTFQFGERHYRYVKDL